MNIMIMTDLEGISGVSSIAHMQYNTPEYQYACERLMADVNAAIVGAIRAGAERVYVMDGHGSGKNFIDSQLDPRATKVSFEEWMKLTRENQYDAFLQIGAHAKAGTLNGFLDHTQCSVRWFCYKIGNESYGEIVQCALIAGLYGIPCVMVSGDMAACEEATACLGEQISVAPVKKGIGRNQAECLPGELAEDLIRAAAEHGIRHRAEIKPFRLPLPMTVEITYTRTDYCDETLAQISDAERVDARTARKTLHQIDSYLDILLL